MRAAVFAFGGRDGAADVDNLSIVPFHRILLLAPWAEVAGYGSAGAYPQRVGALALRGRRKGNRGPIQFPSPDQVSPWTSMVRPEWPDPLAPCRGYVLPTGLPITLQFSDGKVAHLESATLHDDQGNALEICAYDAASYTNQSVESERWGINSLLMSGAAVVIPKQPLRPGHNYTVAIRARGTNYSWSFRAVPSAEISAR